MTTRAAPAIRRVDLSARWQTLLAIDADRSACETYRANFPGVRVECGTVADNLDDLLATDVILGGPPCVSFSFAGDRKGHKDDRDCIPDFVEAVGRVRPRQSLMENVEGLLATDSYPYFCAIIRAFEVLGYIVDYRVLDAVDYGVPQFRKRVFIWCMRRDVYEAKGIVHQTMQATDRSGVSSLRRGVVAGGGRGSRGKITANAVDGVSSSRGKDASARETRIGQPLLSRWSEPNPRKTPRPQTGEQSAEERSVAAATLRKVRRACVFVGGPSHRLRKAVRRALVVCGVPPRGAWCCGVMPWPKPTHAWPAPECMFGMALLPGVTIEQALGLKGEVYRVRAKSWGERPAFDTSEPSMTVLGGAGDGGSTGAMYLRAFGGGTNPHFPGEARTQRDITQEPSTTITASHAHNALPELVLSGPQTPDRPSYTITAGSHQGGPEPIPNRIDRGFNRRLLPEECARLQSMPDDFRWPEGVTKTAKYRIIGNGWACLMALRLSGALAAADPDSRTVIDLFCGGGLGACGWHGRAWQYAGEAVPA